jgi:cyclase
MQAHKPRVTTPTNPLLEAMADCEVVDLSQDTAADRPERPFKTRMEILEAVPGAHLLTETLMPIHFPPGVGKITAETFPDGAFLRHEMVTASSHAGSHVDAPGHYGGPLGPGSFIPDAPLRSFIAEGVMFDAASQPGLQITWEFVRRRLDEQAIHDLAGKIVLLNIGPAKSIEVRLVEELLDRGVTVIGTDNDSFDGPFKRMLQTYLDTGDRSCLWPCHFLGRKRPYYQLENLANLDRLPPQGFLVFAPPILLGGSTAAWSRVVALVPRATGGS